MIRLKFSALEEIQDSDFEIVAGERLQAAVERVTSSVTLPEGKKLSDIFQVAHNGLVIEPDLWPLVILAKEDQVLIAIRLEDGNNGIRSVLFIVAAIAATYFAGPAGFGYVQGTFAFAATTAGLTIAASLAINALIPPSPIDLDSGKSVDESQSYSIGAQSNQVSRFGFVPKAYGAVKMFPLIAANPYTEFETGTNGELVQYLYAIYDFGLGPMNISELRIGDTLISEYKEVTYNLVDLNRPVTDEGFWDTDLKSNFTLYKGDAESESLNLALNANRIAGGPATGYEVTRQTAVNIDNVANSITLTFVNPQGLYSFSSNGDLGAAAIHLEIYYRDVSSVNNPWIPWNHPNFVSEFTSRGGSLAEVDATELLFPAFVGTPFYYSDGTNSGVILQSFTQNIPEGLQLLSTSLETMYQINPTDYRNYLQGGGIYPNDIYPNKVYKWGVKGVLGRMLLKSGSNLQVGRYLVLNGKTLGRISGVSAATGIFAGYSYVSLAGGFPETVLYEYALGTWLPYLPGDPLYPGFPARTIFGNLNSPEIKSRFIPLGQALIHKRETKPGYATFRFTPKNPGQYEVRVTRTSTDWQYENNRVGDLVWADLTTRFDRAPIRTPKRHTFMEIRILATNQLNGSIANLSAVVNSVVPIHDGTNWTRGISNSPAWVFADLLTGIANKRAVSLDRLDVDSLLDWANFCSTIPTPPTGQVFVKSRFESNFILDYNATLSQVLAQVTNSCQASLNIVDGKYGVLIDRKRTVPVQIFTPRNSSGFGSSRLYTTRPHALSVKYVEPGLDWVVRECVVYDDGYDGESATQIEEMTAFGCTNQEQAWRYGRYMLAQNRLRQETIVLQVDFEYLVCTRGDYVQITQDVMRVGGTPARVTSFQGNRITIDDGINAVGGSYGYTFRASTGEIKTSTLTIVSPDTFDLNGDIPKLGDLIVIGEVGLITFDCLVKTITPNDNLTATITLVEKADAVYDAESLNVFPPYRPQISKTSDPNYQPPQEITNFTVVDNFWDCADSGYRYYIDLDWDAPIASAYESFEIYADSGQGFNIVASTKESLYRYIVDPTKLGVPHSFKVLAVSVTGLKLDIGAVSGVTATPIAKTAPPSDVEFLATDITNEVLQLSWTQIQDCDAREYLIRYSPVLDATWQSTIPLLRVDRNTTSASVQARTGTYLIKAVDFNLNESLNVARAITTIPSLTNLNIVSEVTDFPALTGNFDQTVKFGDTLLLAQAVSGDVNTTQYYPEGFYYYADLLDLGEIYTIRLQSLIQAEGATLEDVMSNWVTLSDVALLSNAKTSEWDVESQYRSTDSLNVMADWLQLSLIDPIGGGAEDNFTPWRKFIQGDATGRIFQFRLRLISRKTSVTPRVFDGTIRADMPDRMESFSNLIAPDTGYSVVYVPSFKGPMPSPNVQISIDDAESGDYWQFTSKTLDGFTIQFFDRNGDPVSRQFDAAVRGFGRQALGTI